MLLMKWFAESIYFLEIIFITATSVLLLANNILNVSTKTIHIVALVLLVVYVCIGLLLANRKNKFTMSVNYFKLIGALAYIVLITTLKGIVLRNFSKGQINKIIFDDRHNANIRGRFDTVDNIKESMRSSIASSFSHEFKGLTEIRDEKFRQDTEGNVAGMFKVLLKSGFWGLKHIPLTKVTLTFNLEQEVITMKKNILTTEQASFLKQYNFSLYQERFEVLCKAQKAEKDGHLNFASDDEYKTFIDAVMTGEWSEELFMINLSNPIGCEHFLAAREDGNGGLIWDVVDYSEGDRFTKEQIQTIVPEAYRYSAFMVSEIAAEKDWGPEAQHQRLEQAKKQAKEPEKTIENFSKPRVITDEERHDDYTQSSIRTVAATLRPAQ